MSMRTPVARRAGPWGQARVVLASRACPLVSLLAILVSAVAAHPAVAAETGIVPAPGQTVAGPERAADLGVGWVRLFVNWETGEPADNAEDAAHANAFAGDVAAYHARGIKVLAVVTGSPAWASGSTTGIGAPTDPAKYADFVAYMMSKAPSTDAWELWNEADGNLFWENGPNPGAYAALLRATYPVIKSRNPAATVVSTGMVANNFDFLQQLYDNGAGGYFDAVGVHTDTACLLAPPGFFYRELDGRVGRYAFTGYREVHQVMADHGDGAKPIWMTELGWNTSSTAPNSCRDGSQAGTKAAGVTEAQQARNLTDAYACLAADRYVAVTMWFSLQDIPNRRGYDGHLGLLRTSGAAKPAYAAMKALRNGTRVTPDRSCGGTLDHDAPTIRVSRPADGLRFVGRLSLAASAVDAPGGTAIRHIELLADGKHVLNFKGASFKLDPWYHSSDRLGLGVHTLTFRARDHAGNVSERAVRVEKVRPGELAAVTTSTRMTARARRGRRVTLRGALRRGPSDLPVGGRLYLSVERRVAGRYRRVKLTSARASAPFARTIRLHVAGRYRALARFRGDEPFTASRSPYRAFTIR